MKKYKFAFGSVQRVQRIAEEQAAVSLAEAAGDESARAVYAAMEARCVVATGVGVATTGDEFSVSYNFRNTLQQRRPIISAKKTAVTAVVGAAATVVAGPVVAMGDLDGVHPRVVQGGGDRGGLPHGVLVADGVHAVTQGHVVDGDFLAFEFHGDFLRRRRVRA